MDVLLHGYQVNEPTWFYLSFLLIVAVYFRFNRLFSLRNFDLALLLSASPGLLFVSGLDETTQNVGHFWLFVIACLVLLRLFLDPLLSRRPYLGQNLNSQGLGFLCVAVFAFLMTEAITKSLPDATRETVQRADELLTRTATDPEEVGEEDAAGPAAPLIAAPVGLVFEDLAARILAILAHAAVVSGLWFVGRNLFADSNLGLAMATLYLILPCTAYNVGEFNHVLPAALIIWAFVSYRKPVVAGILLGLACGTMFFPVVLLPIWAAYYGRRGSGRFAAALSGVGVVLLASLAFTSINADSFIRKTIGTINVALMAISDEHFSGGFWKEGDYLSPYRWPVIAAYFVMLFVMTIWPRRRNFEVLIAQSAAVIVGTQLWYPQKGGVYLLWYLPLLLMVMFRPRLIHLRSYGELIEEEHAAGLPKVSSQSPSATAHTATSNNLQLFR